MALEVRRCLAGSGDLRPSRTMKDGEDRIFLLLFAARDYVIAIACRHNRWLKLSLQMGETAPRE